MKSKVIIKMAKDSTIKVHEDYQKISESDGVKRKRKVNITWCLSFSVLAVLVFHSVISIWCLKSDVDLLQKRLMLWELKAKADIQMLQALQIILDDIASSKIPKLESLPPSIENLNSIDTDQNQNDYVGDDTNEEADSLDEEQDDNSDDVEDSNFVFKRKREIRDYNESSVEKDSKTTNKNITEDKYSLEKASVEKSSGEKWSTEMSSLEKSSELSSKEKILGGSHKHYSTRKPHFHRKHRKSRIGSAERFFTETHSTTSTPIQVRQSRTKPTQLNGIDKALWLHNQKFQQHTSPLKDTITKEEALRKGYGKHLEDISYELESSRERISDALTYNMIMIHFSADTSHYSRERDPHYFGNGRMQIKSEVYKDWKPAHWTQGVGMSRYFHLHQGHVTVSTTGIYLIYAQIQYSNVQEVNGFSVFRNNKEVVAQCVTTSTHENKHEIKSNTCGISTTILLQSNDSVCIKDLHHGRYVVLTPEKSYFGLVLLSPFKN